MSREIKTKEDARKWLEDAEEMKGNSCVTKSQAKAPAGIGYHRFDATCPKRDEEYCYMCKAVRAWD